MMKPWAIIQLAAIHCFMALAVTGIFGGTFYLMKRFSPDPSAVWWFGNIDLMLEVIVAIVLALAFLNSLIRIMADLVIVTWRGFPNGDKNLFLV
jgi:hypothetical protein